MDALLTAGRPGQAPKGGGTGGPPPGSDSLDDLRAMARDIDISQIPGGPQPDPDGLEDLRAMAAGIDISQIPGRRRKLRKK
jgi:hypothetical protein